jgi:transcriptional regulator GlxA family with amidase domain
VKVVFLLVPRLHLLDLAGPAQVFSTAADFGYPYELSYVSEQQDVTTAQGLRLRGETTWPSLTAEDLILVPGSGMPTLAAGPKPQGPTLDRLVAHHAAGGAVASVCSGADVLGQACLLDGRRCTTHHDLQDELPAVIRAPGWNATCCSCSTTASSPRPGSPAASTWRCTCSRCGTDRPRPRAWPATWSSTRGAPATSQQNSAMLRYRWHLRDAVHRAQDRIDALFAEPLLLSDLAAVVGVSERTLTRQFVDSTGLTPLRYQQMLRLERAEHLIGHGATVEAAAHAVGFADARMLRRLRARAPLAEVK